jgi:hypothetical protein
MKEEFDDIRPYTDEEIHEAMHRIVQSPFFENIVNFLYHDIPVDHIKDKFLSFNSVNSFQVNVMHSAIQKIIKSSSTGLSFSGIGQLAKEKRYLFLSNHRDILLDSALMQLSLYENGHETSEITFGDNLMTSQFIIDIGKSNKMFRLVRSGTPKEIFKNSMHTSAYIRWALTEKKQSIWIAQRNGRTKDGNDQTQLAVLKMFGMSGGKDFVHNYSELNIEPLSVSYEFDPADFLKTRELYISRRQEYVKAPGEDLNSILTGITQPKGGMHLSFCAPLGEEDFRKIGSSIRNEQVKELASQIDNRIYENFRLWKNNYIAYDILNGVTFKGIYTEHEKDSFVSYMKKGLSNIEGDNDELESIFLAIYANPVVNYIKLTGSSQPQPELPGTVNFKCK